MAAQMFGLLLVLVALTAATNPDSMHTTSSKAGGSAQQRLFTSCATVQSRLIKRIVHANHPGNVRLTDPPHNQAMTLGCDLSIILFLDILGAEQAARTNIVGFEGSLESYVYLRVLHDHWQLSTTDQAWGQQYSSPEVRDLVFKLADPFHAGPRDDGIGNAWPEGPTILTSWRNDENQLQKLHNDDRYVSALQ